MNNLPLSDSNTQIPQRGFSSFIQTVDKNGNQINLSNNFEVSYSLSIEEELNIARKIQNKAQELAKKWVLFWGDNYRYTGATNVKLDFYNNKIVFDVVCRDKSIWVRSISLEYLKDEASLESDSQKWFQKYLKDKAEANFGQY